MKELWELHELHKRIHEHDPSPSTTQERHAAAAMAGLQQRAVMLLADGVPPDIIETSLFYHWLQFTLIGLSCPEDQVEALSEDMHLVAKKVVGRIQEIAKGINDEGPTRDMADLGAQLNALKGLLKTMAQQTLTRSDIERRSMQTTLTVASFIQEQLDRRAHPSLIGNTLLYHWIRLSTMNGDVDEAFFQKLERNWPGVVAGLRPLVESLARQGLS